ncbi:MarR family winged helix-turn-helix transcriptional regulator [Microbacterium sp. 22242]|uniref:MarR family winged helix-turn-helix transcriptional regulator n=1 Tax=Microbacterium sp. 22242 TaxID=3453896 RepID=UPI003F87F5D9
MTTGRAHGAASGDGRTDIDATVIASRALLGIIARSMVPALESVSLPQFRALVVLSSSGAQRMGVLAEKLGITISTFTRTADRLVAGGWAQREANPANRREVLLSLTTQGRDLVSSVTDHRRGLIEDVIDRMSPTDREQLGSSLRAFADAAGEPSGADLLVLGL